MNTIVEAMISKYNPTDIKKEKNAIKEVLQELIISALSKTDFFDKAVFCGGTSLRIVYGLNRFSEDLDFSLKAKMDFNLNDYTKQITEYLKAYGINSSFEVKETKTSVASAFLKTNTLEQLIYFNTDFELKGIRDTEKLKIKFEVDTNPPLGGEYESKFLTAPEAHFITIFKLESLFAGKLHAILCRFWESPLVKGRDLFDFVFYITKKVKPNLVLLKNAMVQSGHFDESKELTIDALKELLIRKFEIIDYELAKRDTFPFIDNEDQLNLWGKEMFVELTKMM